MRNTKDPVHPCVCVCVCVSGCQSLRPPTQRSPPTLCGGLLLRYAQSTPRSASPVCVCAHIRVCVCVCARARAGACVRACVRACVHACAWDAQAAPCSASPQTWGGPCLWGGPCCLWGGPRSASPQTRAGALDLDLALSLSRSLALSISRSLSLRRTTATADAILWMTLFGMCM